MAKPKRLQAGAKAHVASVLEKAKNPNWRYSSLQDAVKVNMLEEVLGDAALWQRSTAEPVLLQFCVGLWRKGDPIYRQYLYQDIFWEADSRYTPDEMKLLVLDSFDEERRTFERLKLKLSSGGDTQASRPSIPEAVRIEVWRRDGGFCKCGSRERLEYDHIIPISKGGSNTARNIELLCENCNRQKGSQIQ